MQNSVNQYIETNKERFLEELFELLRIPSISADSAYKGDVERCAEHLKGSLEKAGVDHAEIYPTDGAPIVYAQKIIDPALPTVLVYAHYDVMPVDPVELWNSAPFEPVVKDGKIWCRGADDDKGQGFMHVKAFEAMIATSTLPCNVKFMLEGEEEIGSGQLTTWVEKYKDLVKADVILVSDTSMLGENTPSITCGLRGLAYAEVKVTGPNRDLHSGLYGGAVANPINVLAQMIGKLIDENGVVTIPGFYDGIKTFTAEERAAIAKAPFDEEHFKSSIGITAAVGEAGYSTMERKGIRPTLDCCGIWGGYIGEGSKTVIPSTAHSKISMRLVAGQDFHDITEKFTKYFTEIAPEGVTVEVIPSHGGYPYMADTDSAAYKAAADAMTEVFGTAPVPFYSGGSIPIISTFERVLGIKSILMGFGLDTDAIHSPNENFPLEQFYKGIKTIPLFYQNFAKQK
ncbi:MAG: dipeptidase [Rikenellaceae bacterium]